MQPEHVNRVRAGRQQLSAEVTECRRQPVWAQAVAGALPVLLRLGIKDFVPTVASPADIKIRLVFGLFRLRRIKAPGWRS